ncbi:PAS domain-containing protein [Thiohalorhabdus sp.]|uniref:PAS domain-containing protein n=1 Tax=Thiohalorhabdus sp. TaxID=3094134 RepID=UPI002FC31045
MSDTLSTAEWSALLQAAMEATYDSVLITDTDFRIIHVNPAFTQLTGYESDEVLGATPRFLQGEDTDSAVLERLRTCISNNEVFEGSAINYRKDGTPFQMQWKVIPVATGNGPTTHYVTVQRGTGLAE